MGYRLYAPSYVTDSISYLRPGRASQLLHCLNDDDQITLALKIGLSEKQEKDTLNNYVEARSTNADCLRQSDTPEYAHPCFFGCKL